MSKSSLPLFLLVGGASSAPALAATGAAISADFVGSGTAMASSESAGVVAKANWNEAAGAKSSSPLSLLDETGAATGATVSWTSDNVWRVPFADGAGNTRVRGGARM